MDASSCTLLHPNSLVILELAALHLKHEAIAINSHFIKQPSPSTMITQEGEPQHIQALNLETAVAISEAESVHVNLHFDLICANPSTETPVTLVMGNYNNGEKIEAVLDSILGQRGCKFRLVILDNHSTDGSWEIIQAYQAKHAYIEIERLSFNTGIFTWCETLLRGPVGGYMMPCSGNDVLINNNLVASLACYLDANEGVCLAYGQSDEPDKQQEYTFSVPEPNRRAIYGELNASMCHDLTTWLYNYSESLWGMYRTDTIKLINPPSSYGSDHVIVSALSCLGGISGVRQVVRQVSSNADRGLDGLRNSQIKRQFSTDETVLTPLEHTNFLMLCYSYFQGIRDSHLPAVDRDGLVSRAVAILQQRFAARMKEEALIYSNLFMKLRALALSRNDKQYIHRLDAEDSFVRLYLDKIFLGLF